MTNFIKLPDQSDHTFALFLNQYKCLYRYTLYGGMTMWTHPDNYVCAVIIYGKGTQHTKFIREDMPDEQDESSGTVA